MELVRQLDLDAGVVGAIRAVFDQYRQDLGRLDQEAKLAIDAGGRLQATAWHADSANRDAPDFWAHLDELQSAWMKLAVEYRSRGDALTTQCLQDMALSLNEADAKRFGELGPDILRIALLREALRAEAERGGGERARWVDCFDLLDRAAAPGNELSSDSPEMKAILEDAQRASKLHAAIEAARRIYRDDLSRVAALRTGILRTPPARNYATLSSENPKGYNRLVELRREKTRCGQRCALAIAETLDNFGAPGCSRAWLLRFAREATPLVFTATQWSPSVDKWLRTRTDVAPEVLAAADAEIERYLVDLDILRLDASNQAILCHMANKDQRESASQSLARAMAKMWCLNVEHLRRIHSILAEPARSEFWARLNETTPFANSRMPIFDLDELAWLRDRKILPLVDKW